MGWSELAAPPDSPPTRSLVFATLAAVAVAILVLTLFVLPAEYGIDPTGIGAVTGVARLAPDAEQDAGADDAGQRAEQETPASQTLRTYESSFPVTTREVWSAEGELREGETAMIPFMVDDANVTRLMLRLEFIDADKGPDGQQSAPDTFEIELKSPTGDVSGRVLVRSDPKSGGGHGEAIYVVRERPVPRSFEAASEAEARAAFTEAAKTDTSHMGEWRARVTLVEAGDASVQGIPVAAAADEGNSWSLVVIAETFSLDVTPKPGSERRADVTTLTIPGGGELEYKLAMTFGARVDYAWRTDGPSIYVDFHGERDGDDSGAFTRHKNGDFAADAGSLTAPFDGRHGWFWRNTNGAPVTVTLETRGQYAVIGRV